MAIITSKRISIKSRGRYQHKFGVTYGPTRNWYRERVDHIIDMLLKYPDIEIIEDIGNGDTIRLTLQNVRTDNRRKPVSMMESNEEKKEDATAEAPAQPISMMEKAPTPVEEVKPEVATEENTETVILDGEEIEKKEEAAAEAPAQNQQPSYYNNKKKGKKNNGNNLAVTPKEP